MIWLMVVFSSIALILQLAVLRDPTIKEVRPQVYMRRISIIAHFVSLGTGAALLWYGDDLRYPLVLVVILLSVKDVFGATYRLWPEVFEAEAKEVDPVLGERKGHD